MTTTSEISFAGDGQLTSDVLLLGAAGNSGRLIAAELAARGLSVRLAGRRRGPLEDLARILAADGATADVRTVDVGDPASLADAIAGVGVVLSTIGPFARLAGPVIDACLAATVPYVDIANEWPAVRGLLDRDDQARAHAVTLVTGAGFGLPRQKLWSSPLNRWALRRTSARRSRCRANRQRRCAPDDPRVPCPRRATYRDGQVVRDALGNGATVLAFGGAQRQMLPAGR